MQLVRLRCRGRPIYLQPRACESIVNFDVANRRTRVDTGLQNGHAKRETVLHSNPAIIVGTVVWI